MKNIFFFNLKIFFLVLVFLANSLIAQKTDGIDIYKLNPSYWQYNGKPLLLLGGSSEDNLFQIPDLEDEINIIKECGGNYVRNTLSSRDSGNVWPFYFDIERGKYNLEHWNDEYWDRLDKLFQITATNEIIVQLELWATFDYYREHWDVNPFNPKNNINYTSKRTKLDTEITTHPIYTENRFFSSVPLLDNNMRVLEYQQKFIDKVLSYSLNYNNILYCIDNETSVSASWGQFWAKYLSKIAEEKGKKIHITEMWDPHNLNHISHRETFDHPEIYSFVEISQNNHQKGESHWNNGIKQINRLSKPALKRPVNNIKTYGNDLGRHGHGTQNGKESFIRNIFFGSASSRFHRPNSGLGISKIAQRIIKSTRMMSSEIDFFNSKIGNHLLTDLSNNEAYCRYVNDKEYAIFFTDGGNVNLNCNTGRYTIKWLNIEKSVWESESIIEAQNIINLSPSSDGMWFAIVKKNLSN